MDMRYDLESIWLLQEKNNSEEQIFLKLILPNGTQDECQHYLRKNNIAHNIIFSPESVSD